MPRGIPKKGKKTMGKRGPQKKYVKGFKKDEAPKSRTSAKNIVMTKFDELNQLLTTLTQVVPAVDQMIKSQLLISQSMANVLNVQKASFLDAWKLWVTRVAEQGAEASPEAFMQLHPRSVAVLGITREILVSEYEYLMAGAPDVEPTPAVEAAPEIKTPEVELHVSESNGQAPDGPEDLEAVFA